MKHWFRLWVIESDSIRRLCELSGYGASKIKEIKNYWLRQTPKEHWNYKKIKYLVYDGTYFHKDGCLINLMNAQDQKIIACTYASKEGFQSTYSWFLKLKEQGLNPKYISMDGERSVIRAIKKVWPSVKIQRCLFHILREGLRWLRTYPKTPAGIELRYILKTLCCIKTIKEQKGFIKIYDQWRNQYEEFIRSLPLTSVAFKDLKRTRTLIDNALPDMFYYLKNQNIHSTTNALEGFHSRLKADYRRHRGLSKQNRINYLSWYCYFKNGSK